jgi:hypothetical protein
MPKLTVCPGCGRLRQYPGECHHCGLLAEPIPATAHGAKTLRERYDHDQVRLAERLLEREAFVEEHGEAAWFARLEAEIADLF